MYVEEGCKTPPIYIPETTSCGGCEGYGERISALENKVNSITVDNITVVTPWRTNDLEIYYYTEPN